MRHEFIWIVANKSNEKFKILFATDERERERDNQIINEQHDWIVQNN